MYLYVAREADVSVVAVLPEQILLILRGASAWRVSVSAESLTAAVTM